MKLKHIEAYWNEVSRILCVDYGEETAKQGIANYRAALRKLKVGDIIYHSSPDDTAKGIITGEYLKDVITGEYLNG